MTGAEPYVIWAHEAADTADEVARELARVEPEVPLSVFPTLAADLSGLAERASETLRLTGRLAAAEAGGKPGRSGEAPDRLAAASRRAAAAGELLDDARALIHRDLRKAGIRADPDGWPLRPSPAGAYWCLASLNRALAAADPAGDGTLDGLVLAAEQETLILEAARRPCGPVADGIRDACRAMPGGAAASSPKAADQVQRAGQAITRASVFARGAFQSLAGDRDRARKNAGARR